MPLLSPGAAAASAIQDFILERKEQQRQARLDAEAAEDRKLRMQRAEKLLEREEADSALKLEDRERATTEKEIEGMVIGDVPGPDLQARAKKHRIPMRMAVQAPKPEEVEAPGIITEMGGETPVAPMPEGTIRFAGSPAQAKEAEAKEAQRKFIESLTGPGAAAPGKGGTGAAQSAAARAVGLPMSAADFEPPADRAKSATIQEYDFYKAEELAAGRTPLGFDAYQARDANRKRPVVPAPLAGGMDPKTFDNARKLQAQLSSNPVYRDMIDVQTGYLGVEQALSGSAGLGDIAAINAFQRMIDPGATVREGDVQLIQSATAWFEKMNPDFWVEQLKKGAKLPEPMRQEMRRISKELYKTRARNYETMVGSQMKNLAKGAGVPYDMVGSDFVVEDAPGKVTKSADDYIKQYGGAP